MINLNIKKFKKAIKYKNIKNKNKAYKTIKENIKKRKNAYKANKKNNIIKKKILNKKLLKKLKRLKNFKNKKQSNPYKVFLRCQKIKGVKVVISGRIRGIAKARVRKFKSGPLGTSTITKSIYYCSKPIYTKWGIMGLKLFKT
jgi:ribosomal protein S3